MANCLLCGKEFKPKLSVQKFCCNQHRWKYNSAESYLRKKSGTEATKRNEYKEYTEERDKKICYLRFSGVEVSELADQFGISEYTVNVICQRNHVGKQIREKRNQDIVSLRKQGYSMTQIQEMFGLSNVSDICKKYGVGGVMSDRKAEHIEYSNGWDQHRQDEYAKRMVEQNLPGFSFVGNYTGSDGTVDIKCLECGDVFTQPFETIRRGKKVICRNCKKIDQETKRAERESERLKLKAERASESDLFLFMNTFQVECAECGKVFMTRRNRQKCCSTACGNKYNNRKSTKRKDKRIPKSKKIDRGITAKVLYQKEHGVCWICGGKCDLNDYTVKNGAVICGNNYPSVDHIVPVAYGGEDSWDNVRLAHRICNTKRFNDKKLHPPFRSVTA